VINNKGIIAREYINKYIKCQNTHCIKHCSLYIGRNRMCSEMKEQKANY